MEQISEARLAEVHPELARRVRQLAQLLEADGIILRVVQGLRTWSQQNALYAQGRTAPGPIVTNAQGGLSAHNFGYAVDCAPNNPDFPTWTPDWNSSDDRWKDLLSKALTCGLKEGAMWRHVKPDNPHFYLQELPDTPDDNMRAIFQGGGLEAVWNDWVSSYSVNLEAP